MQTRPMRAPFTLRVLAERLSGKTAFEARYYRESQLTRLANLFAHVDLERWRGMRILEVGAGLGHLGDAFAQLGFDVTSTDGRPEHVDAMRARGREAFVLDLDTTGVDEVGDYDVILAFGVLYHLAQPEKFLRSCGNGSQVLLLETAVCDAAEPVVRWVSEAGGWRGQDQALSGQGCRPSPAWVEEICTEAGFDSVRDISSGLGNWVIGAYDWEPRNTGDWRHDGINLRKMWVCEKQA
jgi:Methyltransferase domain